MIGKSGGKYWIMFCFFNHIGFADRTGKSILFTDEIRKLLNLDKNMPSLYVAQVYTKMPASSVGFAARRSYHDCERQECLHAEQFL